MSDSDDLDEWDQSASFEFGDSDNEGEEGGVEREEEEVGDSSPAAAPTEKKKVAPENNVITANVVDVNAEPLVDSAIVINDTTTIQQLISKIPGGIGKDQILCLAGNRKYVLEANELVMPFALASSVTFMVCPAAPVAVGDSADRETPASMQRWMAFLEPLGLSGYFDGDALLSMLAADFKSQPQILPVIAAHERFLSHFLRRGCLISVVYFPNNRFEEDPLMKLLRSIVCSHLSCLVNDQVQVVRPASNWAEETSEYQLMLRACNGWFFTYPEYANVISSHQSFNIVSAERVEFRAKEIHAFVIPRVATREGESRAAPHTIVEEQPELVSVDTDGLVLDALEQMDTFPLHKQLLCFTYYATKLLTINQRSFILPGEASPEDMKLHWTFGSHINKVIGDRSLDLSGLLDCIDIRLFRLVKNSSMKLSSAIPAAVMSRFKWSDVSLGGKSLEIKPRPSLDDDNLLLFPVPEDFLDDVLGSELPRPAVMDLKDPRVSLPQKQAHSFYASHGWSFEKPLQLKDTKKVIKKKQKTVAYQNRSHTWLREELRRRHLKDIGGFKDLVKRLKKHDTRLLKRPQKKQQKLAFWLTKQAESLGGPGSFIVKRPIILEGNEVKAPKKRAPLKKIVDKDLEADLQWWKKNKDEILSNPLDYATLSSHLLKRKSTDAIMQIRKEVFDALVMRRSKKKKFMMRLIFDMSVSSHMDVEEMTKQLKFESDEQTFEFQLEKMGPLLIHPKGEKDDRIEGFCPDPWQVKLLNVVDSNFPPGPNSQSALVVAPTSSGKTFIANYIVEKVLRADTEGTVVFVAPTKALVNQIRAAIVARYEVDAKTRYKTSGRVMCGVFTADWRYRADNCQVLVTVPECLEILLTAPSREQQRWINMLRFIIYDEVHNLNDPSNGHVWERVLQLTRCPFVALSATLGDPNAFKEWLEDHGKRSVALIQHTHRYNDLRYSRVMAGCSHREINPLAPLRGAHNVALHGFPSYISFEPKDALKLWKLMAKKDAARVAHLRPDVFFKDSCLISRADFRNYEAGLKTEFIAWCKDDEFKEFADGVIRNYSSDHGQESAAHAGLDDINQILFDLKDAKDLPAIVFCFSRDLTELLAKNLLEAIHKKEEDYVNSPTEQARRKKVAARLKVAEKRLAKVTDELKSKNKLSPQEEQRKQGAELEVADLKRSINEIPADLFPMRLPGQGKGPEYRKELIDSLTAYSMSADDVLVKGLQYGIGVHHEGLPSSYRHAVEILFRSKDLTVCFSTTTLAQGINMPCRSVVIAHDSEFLNALSFRQMAGRAGRRGYDDLGKVVFVDVAWGRILGLMASPSPHLRGCFPLDISFVVRMLQLNHGVKTQQKTTKAQLAEMVGASLLGANGNSKDDALYQVQLRHFMRFSIELLCREGLINAQLEPVGIVGLITHLGFLEPGNFLLLQIFKDGLFNDIFMDEVMTKDEKYLRVIELLACILNPHPIPKGALNRESALRVPESLRKAISKFNNRALRLFMAYSRTYASDLPQETMPLSGWGGINDSKLDLGAALSKPHLRSVFSAIQGKSDDWQNYSDFILEVRDGIYVDHSIIPHQSIDHQINAYVVEFFKHGDIKLIEVENGVSGAWFDLKDVSLCLQTIATALDIMEREKEDPYLDANMFKFRQDSRYDKDPSPNEFNNFMREVTKKFSSLFNMTKEG